MKNNDDYKAIEPTKNQRARPGRSGDGWYEWEPVKEEKLPAPLQVHQILQVLDGHFWVTGVSELFPVFKYKQYGRFVQKMTMVMP